MKQSYKYVEFKNSTYFSNFRQFHLFFIKYPRNCKTEKRSEISTARISKISATIYYQP